jgi:mycothiol synthase
MGEARGVTALTVRRLTADDVGAMVELNALCDIAETGEPDAEVLDWIRDGAGDYTAFGVEDEHGLAACGWIDLDGHHTGFETDVRVRPGLDPDLGRPILDEIRALAAAADPVKPLHFFCNTSAERARSWLAGLGASEIRHFWRMRIDLDETAPAVAPAPDGVVVREVRNDEDDLRIVWRIVDTSFAEHFGHVPGRSFEKWIADWRKRSQFDVTLWRVAELHGEPVAAMLGSIIDNNGHVATLGTLKAARARGIGAHLLHVAFAEFHRRGKRAATLGVDSENGTGAVRLYESVGMRSVLEWVLYELKQ